MSTAAEGSETAVRTGQQPGLPRDIGSLVERELERVEALAREQEYSSSLAALASFFDSHVQDGEARSAIDAARHRAQSLSGFQTPSSWAVMTFAGEAFDICALDCGWGAAEAAELVRELVSVLGEPAAAAGAGLFLASSRNPQLLELPPRVALQMQLEILVAFAPVDDVSLWVAGERPGGARHEGGMHVSSRPRR